MPIWDEYVGGEAYNVILDNENYNFNSKVSMKYNFNGYVISIEDGILSLRKECWEDYCPIYDEYLVVDGVVAKDNLNETVEVLKSFGAKYEEFIKKQEEAKRKQDYEKRKSAWLKSSIYEVEIKGW